MFQKKFLHSVSYIKGNKFDQTSVSHKQITQGGVLHFEMGLNQMGFNK
jgi:putative alpha-1,2-mannosidase